MKRQFIWTETPHGTYRLWLRGKWHECLVWALNVLCLWGGADRIDADKQESSWEFRDPSEEVIRSLLTKAGYIEVTTFSEDGD